MLLQWILDRLREPSTYKGFSWLLTAIGISVKPELWTQITALGMVVAGLIDVITKEHKPVADNPQNLSPIVPVSKEPRNAAKPRTQLEADSPVHHSGGPGFSDRSDGDLVELDPGMRTVQAGRGIEFDAVESSGFGDKN